VREAPRELLQRESDGKGAKEGATVLKEMRMTVEEARRLVTAGRKKNEIFFSFLTKLY
jgi:pyrroloquinoline quinone (PQQ) biosynthesis protein C